MSDQYTAAYNAQMSYKKALTQEGQAQSTLTTFKKTAVPIYRSGVLVSVLNPSALIPYVKPGTITPGAHAGIFTPRADLLAMFNKVLSTLEDDVKKASNAVGSAFSTYQKAPNRAAYEVKISSDAANEKSSGGFFGGVAKFFKATFAVATEPIKISVATITKAVDTTTGLHLTDEVLGATQIPGLSHRIENAVTTTAAAVGAILGAAAVGGAKSVGPKNVLDALKGVPAALSGSPSLPNAKAPSYASDMSAWDTNSQAVAPPANPAPAKSPAGPLVFAGIVGISLVLLF